MFKRIATALDPNREESEDFGVLYIPDPVVLLRPARADSLDGVQHDDLTAALILGLAQRHETFIYYSGSHDEAHALLDPVFAAYAERRCMGQDCFIVVTYLDGDGRVARTTEYGRGNSYRLSLNVCSSVPDEFVETLLVGMTGMVLPGGRYVVVRPDDTAEHGFVATGYTVLDEEADDAESGSSG